MKIIVLFEKGHTGKTTTLKNLCKKIEIDTKTTNIIIAPNYSNEDIVAIFEFNDKVVGITSYGDNKWVLERPYQLFEQFDCDIIISAGRRKNTKNGSVGFIKAFALKHSATVKWIKKDYVDTVDDSRYKKEINSINKYMVNLLFGEI